MKINLSKKTKGKKMLSSLKNKFKQAYFKHPKYWQYEHMITAVFFIVIVGGLGAYLIFFSSAASQYGAIVGQGSYCLDNWEEAATDGNLIDLYPCNGTKAQQWNYNSTTGVITNVNGWCLDDYGDSQTSEAKVDLWWCNGTAAQKWVVNATAGTIMHGSLCLDNKWGDVTPKNPIWLYTCNGTAAQHWVVNTAGGTSSTPVTVAPSITSASSTTFTEGTAGSFTVTDTGTPTPTLSESGTLPSGITFNTSNGVLSGTATTSGTFDLTFTSSNGVSPNAVQSFTLTVNAPASTGTSGGSSSGSGSGSSGGGTTTGGSSIVTPASLMPDSIFNQPVTSWAVDANSSEYVTALINDYKAAYGNFGVNESDPIFSVTSSTPTYSLSVSSGCNNFLSDTGSTVPVPSGLVLSGTSDNPLFMYSTSLNKIWEFWQFSKSGSGYSACWGGEATLSTFTGVFLNPYGESADGISYTATAVTEADVESGAINHTIAMTLTSCNGDVYPADRTDCGSDPGNPGEGQWFRFSPSATMPSGLTPFAQMVFKAVQKYGMVVTDKSGAIQISTEDPSDWAAQGNSGTDPITTAFQGQQEYTVINSLPWSELQVVDPPGH